MSAREHRILVLGSLGAGKSTLIHTVAHIRRIAEAGVSGDSIPDEIQSNPQTNSATLDLPNGDRLYLSSSTEQVGRELIDPVELQEASGIVVLVDAADAHASDEFERYLQVLASRANGAPAVIGLSKADLIQEFDMRPWQVRQQVHGLVLPLVPFDARDSARIMLLMDVLMCEIEALSLISRYR